MCTIAAIAAVLLAGFAHGVDELGNKLFEEKLHDPARSQVYKYDRLNRLTRFDEGTTVADAEGGRTVAAPVRSGRWTLDEIGNWTNFRAEGYVPSAVGGATQAGRVVVDERTFNADHQIAARTVRNRLPPAPAQVVSEPTYTYDGAGNLADDGKFEYVYDEENRLTRVNRSPRSGHPDAGELIGEYEYDALGRRASKIYRKPDGLTEQIKFFYDGERVIEERDNGDHTLRQYVWGNYVDELLMMFDVASGKRYFALHNSNWNVVALMSDAGTVVERYEYDPYGSVEILGKDRPIQIFDPAEFHRGVRVSALRRVSRCPVFGRRKCGICAECGRVLA